MLSYARRDPIRTVICPWIEYLVRGIISLPSTLLDPIENLRVTLISWGLDTWMTRIRAISWASDFGTIQTRAISQASNFWMIRAAISESDI